MFYTDRYFNKLKGAVLSADDKVSGLLVYYFLLICLFGFETLLHVA